MVLTKPMHVINTPDTLKTRAHSNQTCILSCSIQLTLKFKYSILMILHENNIGTQKNSKLEFLFNYITWKPESNTKMKYSNMLYSGSEMAVWQHQINWGFNWSFQQIFINLSSLPPKHSYGLLNSWWATFLWQTTWQFILTQH